MPWNSHYGSDMQGACREIPGSAQGDQGYSTPDVFGRAVQLYIALERAAQDQDFQNETVALWRSLLSIVALRNMLDLPLIWNYVQISPGDPLSNALSFPPKNADQLLYPMDPAYQWDGQTFYALSWAPPGQDPVELAIYSPMTLVYPVADWQKVFAGIPQLEKFYDSTSQSFKSHNESLQGGELNFVYPWLRDMREHLAHGEGNSNAKRNIILHLDQFMRELSARDNSLSSKKLPLSPEKFEYTAQLERLVPQMVTAYGIGGPVFSDQLCVLQVNSEESNPLESCSYSDNYKIENGQKSGVNLYAFLPIHPRLREQCRENGIAESIHMKLIHEGGKKPYIRVSASTTELPGIRLEKDYQLVDEESAERNKAVYYKDEFNRNFTLNKDIWPLFSVWPTTLDANWKQYYIMRESSKDCLRIEGESGTSAEQAGIISVEQGDNPYVVRVPYVPDAIPLVRMIRDENGKCTDQSVSVGMVTPQRGISVRGAGNAIVAVDFGTSSTRVFYTLVGNNQPVHEIYVVQDKPLEVSKYEGSMDRAIQMGTDFISPVDDKDTRDGTGDVTLFSIFRRSATVNRTEVRPLLDGAIYQPTAQVGPNSTDNLVTDLKWNGPIARPYYIAFMQQLCLHIMTYLYRKYQIAHIEWRYALPRVMDQSNQVAMNSIWQNDVKGFLDTVSANTITHTISMPPTPEQPRPPRPLLTESIAASRYFDSSHSRQISPRKGYLVVDIGGGSTDVALWQQSGTRPVTSLKWHTSVRVAGRKMFTQWVEECIDGLSAGIDDEATQSLLNTINKGNFSRHQDTGAREALVDRLLTSHSEAIHANYNTNLNTQPDQWGGQLLSKLTHAVTLLMFSLGYQTGALMKCGRYTVPPGPGGYFTIAFGGRGSNILTWLTCDTTTLTEFFKDGVAAAGAEWPVTVPVTTITSHDPKCEVALGLLVPVPVGAPTGWENVGKGEVMDDPYYYADEFPMEETEETGCQNTRKIGAATAYYEAFKRRFPSNDIRDLSDESSQGELGASANRVIMADAYVDDVFKVLMESIYDVLEESSVRGGAS